MAIPYHTHNFQIPTAEAEDVIAGTRDDVPVTPKALKPALDLKANTAELGTAAGADVGDFASAAEGELAVSALQPTTGVYRIATFAAAPTASIPAAVERVFVEDRAANFVRVDADPAHSIKFQNGGWWEIDEPVITSRAAGMLADDVTDDRLQMEAAFRVGLPVELIDVAYRVSMTKLPIGNVVEICGITKNGKKPVIKAASATAKQVFMMTRDFSASSNTVKGVIIRNIDFDGEHVRSKRGWPWTDFSADDYGAQQAFQFAADPADPDSVFILENCAFRRFPSLPFSIYNFKTVVIDRLVTSRTKDPGIVSCRDVVINDVLSEYSADNGISLSRGCKSFSVKGGVVRDAAIAGLWAAGYNITGSGSLTVAGPSYLPLSTLSLSVAGSMPFAISQKGAMIVVVDANGNQAKVKITDIISATQATAIALDAIPAALQGSPAAAWYYAPSLGPSIGTIGGMTIVGSYYTQVGMQHGPRNITVQPNTIMRSGMCADSEVVTRGSVAAGSNQLILESAADFLAGDWVIIDPDTSLQDYWIGRIQSITGNVATLYNAAPNGQAPERTYANEDVRLLHVSNQGSSTNGWTFFITGNGLGGHTYAENIMIEPQTIIDYRNSVFYLGNQSLGQGSVRGIRVGRCLLRQPLGLGATGIGRAIIDLREQAGTVSHDILVSEGMDIIDDDVPLIRAHLQDNITKRRIVLKDIYAPNVGDSSFAFFYDISNGNAEIVRRYFYSRVGADGISRSTGWKAGQQHSFNSNDADFGIVNGVLDVKSAFMSVTPMAANVDITQFSITNFDPAGLPMFVLRNPHGTNSITLKYDVAKILTKNRADLVIPPGGVVWLVVFPGSNIAVVVAAN